VSPRRSRRPRHRKAPTVDEAADGLAPLGIAVNNVGIPGDEALVTDYPLEAWRRVMDLNLARSSIPSVP
jgi:NAD(P)-dependent dehydrogenase (short-subunit alcohol dehydrogenase family)